MLTTADGCCAFSSACDEPLGRELGAERLSRAAYALLSDLTQGFTNFAELATIAMTRMREWKAI